MTVIRLISNNNESAYRAKVQIWWDDAQCPLTQGSPRSLSLTSENHVMRIMFQSSSKNEACTKHQVPGDQHLWELLSDCQFHGTVEEGTAMTQGGAADLLLLHHSSQCICVLVSQLITKLYSWLCQEHRRLLLYSYKLWRMTCGEVAFELWCTVLIKECNSFISHSS